MIRTDYMKLLRKIAWSFHFTTGLPIEELYSECCLQYYEARLTYNGTRPAKFTTYLTSKVTYQLIDYIKQENKIQLCSMIGAPDIGRTPVYEYWNWFKPDIQTIVDIVKNSNGEISGVPPKMARGVIRRELREQGWSWPRIWDAIRETKSTLNEMEIGSIIG